MDLSVWLSTGNPWTEVAERARTVEALGFHGIWIADHFMPDDGMGPVTNPMLECLGVLAGLATVTSRPRLGSLVLSATYRQPAVLANTAATIDIVSGGRLVLGVGAGWQVNEHEMYGIPLGPPRERIARFEETCQVLRGLRDQARTTVEGEHVRVTDAVMEPKPAGPLPLLIGSSGPRMARVVARHADEWNTWGTPDGFAEKVAHVDRALEEAGREPSTLRRSTQALVFVGPDGATTAEAVRAMRPAIGGTVEQLAETLAAYRDAGVDELIVPDFTLGAGDAFGEQLAALLEAHAAA